MTLVTSQPGGSLEPNVVADYASVKLFHTDCSGHSSCAASDFVDGELLNGPLHQFADADRNQLPDGDPPTPSVSLQSLWA